MARIITLGHMSLDGYMADPDGRIDWITMDAEIAKLVEELWRDAAGTIYGRKTYELMDPFWPDVKKHPEKWPDWMVNYAEWVDGALKVVVSRTLTSIAWRNTRVIGDPVVEGMRRLKAEVSGNLLLLGSGQLMGTLLAAGLIDELVVTITPVLLGKGRPYFSGFPEKVNLDLLEQRKFPNGVAALRYAARPEGASR